MNSRIKSYTTIGAVILAWLANPLIVTGSASISGRVISREYPNYGVSKVVVSADTGQNATTDNNGDYTLANVTAGNRTITAKHSDYWASGNNDSVSQTVQLNSDKTGVNFTSFQCKATPEVSLTVDKSKPKPGETVRVTVTLKNSNYAVASVDSYLDLSFDPALVTVGNPVGSDWTEGPIRYPKGHSPIYGVSGAMTATEDLITAKRAGPVGFNATYSFTVPLTIKSTAAAGNSISLKYRGTIGARRDPVSTGAGTRDQQGFNVKTSPVTIESAYSIRGRVISREYPKYGVPKVVVSVDTGQNATTDNNGDYTLANVTAGSRTITAKHSDYWASGNNDSVSQTVQLNSDKTGVNFTSFQCKATPEVSLTVDKPKPKPGETVTVTVTLKNSNYAVASVDSYLDLSFDPALATVGNPVGSDWTEGPIRYPKGHFPIYGVSGAMTATEDLITATRAGPVGFNVIYSFTVPLTIKSTAAAGSLLTLKYRGTIGDRRDPVSTGTGTRDQQGFNVKTSPVTIESSYSIRGRVISREYPNYGVSKVIVSADTGQSATTDNNGDYALANVTAGSRTITAKHPDYWASGNNDSVSQPVQLNSDKTGVNFANFQCKATPEVSLTVDKPKPKPGETANVTVTLKNTNFAMNSVDSYLDLSFDPALVTVGNPVGSDWTEGPIRYPKGQFPIYGVSGAMTATEDLITAKRAGSFGFNVPYSFTVPLTIKSTAVAGSLLTLKYRGTIGDRRDPVSNGTGDRDQQEYNIKTNTITVAPVEGVDLTGFRVLAALGAPDGRVLHLYAKPTPGQKGFDKEPFLVPANFGQAIAVCLVDPIANRPLRKNEAISQGLLEHVANLVMPEGNFGYFFPYRRFEKSGNVLYAPPVYRPLVLEVAFLWFDYDERAELYYQKLLDIVAGRNSELPADSTRLEQTGLSSEPLKVERLNAADAAELAQDLVSIAGSITDAELRAAVAAKAISFQDIPVTSAANEVAKYIQGQKANFDKLNTFFKFSGLVADLANLSLGHAEQANAEMALRAYLNMDRKLSQRVAILQEAYDFAKQNEPQFDGALSEAINRLVKETQGERGQLKSWTQNALQDLSVSRFIGVAQQAVEVAQNLKLQPRLLQHLVSGEYALKLIRSIKENSGSKWLAGLPSNTDALNGAVNGLVTFLRIAEGQIDFYKDYAAIVTISRMLLRYAPAVPFADGSELLKASISSRRQIFSELNGYAIAKVADTVFQKYSPRADPWAFSAWVGESVVGAITAPATAGWSLIGPVITAFDTGISWVQKYKDSDEIGEFASIQEEVFQGIKRDHEDRKRIASFLADAYLTDIEPPVFPAAPTILRITPVLKQTLTVGDSVILPVELNGLAAGDAAQISYTGFVNGTSIPIQLDAAGKMPGLYQVKLSATSVKSGSDSLTFQVEVVRQNTKPTLSPLPDVSVVAGETLTVSMAVGDSESGAEAVALRAVSSKPNVIRQDSLRFEGTGPTRLLRITSIAGVEGQTRLSVYASDGDLEEVQTFTLVVTNPSRTEIEVRGKGKVIANGNTTPTAEDDTDLGAMVATGSTVIKVFTIKNLGTASLSLTGNPIVAKIGTNADDFVIKQPASNIVPVGGQATVEVAFTPSEVGIRTVKLSIPNNDTTKNPYTFVLQGTGIQVSDTNRLVLHFPFSGDARDQSGNGNHGIVHNATLATDRIGNPNSAYSFNGTNSFIEVFDNDALDLTNDFSLFLWVNPKRVASEKAMVLLNKATAGPVPPGTWLLMLANPNGRADFSASPYALPNIGSSANPPPGIWTHIGVTYEKSRKLCKIYWNGRIDRMEEKEFSILNSTNRFLIGAHDHPDTRPIPQYFFDGTIDDVRIYGRALTPDEVLRLTDGCRYTLTPIDRQHGPGPESGSIGVSAANECPWTAISSVPWLTITSGATSTGSRTINYSTAVNTAAVDRTGVIKIADQTFTVTQTRSGQPPVITLSPQNQTVNAGANVTFQVTVNGSAPLTYQWLFNGSPLNGATSATLSLSNVHAANTGGYSVNVANQFGLTASSAATLKVLPAIPAEPTIGSIPDQQTPMNVDTGIIAFNVGDFQTACANLVVTAASENQTLVPSGNIQIAPVNTGTPCERLLIIRPRAGGMGASKITVTVRDPENHEAKTSFTLTVIQPTAPPPTTRLGDFNGDGDTDLIFQSSDGGLAAWFMSGANLKLPVWLAPNSIDAPSYRIAGSGDFDGNGDEDLIFQHGDGTLLIWYMNGTKRTQSTLMNPRNPGDRNWRVAAVADVNRDGTTDLLFQHTDGTLAVWFMSGISLSSSALINPSSPGNGWKVAGTADFNSDGAVDLLFQHNDGTLAVWLLDGTRLVKAELFSPSNPGAGWRLVSTVDRNQDGKPDLLFQHANLDLAVWFMDGVKLGSAQLLNPKNPGGTWKVVAPK